MWTFIVYGTVETDVRESLGVDSLQERKSQNTVTMILLDDKESLAFCYAD